MNRKRVAIASSFFRLGQWRGIMRYGQEVGWICQRHDRDSVARLANWNPDGMLFQVDEFDQPLLDHVRRSSVPRVGLRALLGREEETPLVLLDLAGFGRKIATHFLANNTRRLAYLGPASDEAANSGCTHLRGMSKVAEAQSVPLEIFHPDRAETWKRVGLRYRKSSSMSWESFWKLGPALVDYLARDPEPAGLFCAFAEPAMEFIEMADDRQVAIPDRISMVAQSEDALVGEVTKVPLTCLVPDYERQGYEAARLLDRIMGGDTVAPNHRQYIGQCELIARESSNRIVTADPVVREMLDHIRRHSLNFDYTPGSLAAAFGRSLRFVQLRFREALGRGVAEVIRQHRTEHAADLIMKTKRPLQQIVVECGFSDHHQLERAIKKKFGVNPSKLRRQRPPQD